MSETHTLAAHPDRTKRSVASSNQPDSAFISYDILSDATSIALSPLRHAWQVLPEYTRRP